MASVGGCLIVNGIPRNGATVKLWSSGAFGSPPAKNTPLPVGNPIASGVTDVSNGGDGSYRITGVSAGEYYTSLEWNGIIEYDYHNLISAQIRDLKATYGAVGDGIVDDTMAVQAWANSISGSTSDTMQLDLVIPPGIYKITSTIQTPALGSNFRMLGSGYRSSIFQWAGTSGVPMFLFRDCRGGEFQDFACQGLSAASGRPSACIELRRTAAWTAGMAGPYESRFERLFVGGTSASATVTGILFNHAAPSGNDTNNDIGSFIDVSCQNCSSYGIQFNSSNALWHNIHGGYFVNCQTAGISNCQSASATQGGGFNSYFSHFTNCGTCFELGRSHHSIQIVMPQIEGCSGFCNTPYTITATDGTGMLRTHVNVLGGTLKVTDGTMITFDAGTNGHLSLRGLKINSPNGITVNFPTSGSFVDWDSGLGVIAEIKYNCNLTMSSFRFENTTLTWTNLGAGKLRLYDTREDSGVAPLLKSWDVGIPVSGLALTELRASGRALFQPDTQNQEVLTLGAGIDNAGVNQVYTTGNDSARLKFHGPGKRHGYLTYRPADFLFYLTAWSSAFDDSQVALKVNGKVTAVAGADIGASGSVLLAVVSNTATWDPPNLADGAQQTTTVGVTGAAVGDQVVVGFSNDQQATVMTGYVSAANVVTVVHRNNTGGAINLASGTLRATVLKF